MSIAPVPQLRAVSGGSAQAPTDVRRPAAGERDAESIPHWLSIRQIAKDLGISVSIAYRLPTPSVT